MSTRSLSAPMTDDARRLGAVRATSRLAGRLTRSSVVVAAAAAGLSAVVVWQYRSITAGSVDLTSLELLAANPAIRVLFGPPIGLDTAGGFTVWRMGTPLAVLLSVWAILTITRVTRGDEGLGRWELLHAGTLRRAELTAIFLGAVAAGSALAGAGVAGAMIIAGAAPAGSAGYGLALAFVGVAAAGAGALAAQLVPQRRQAVIAAVGLVVAGQAIRMVGDGVPSLSWLLWTSPYGLLALVEPFTAARTAPLMALAGLALGCCAAAVWAAGRRDHLAGLVPATARRHARPRLLRSPGRFLVRRHASTALTWLVGVATYFVLIGALSTSVTRFMTDAPEFARLAAQAGFPGLGTVDGYLAALFTVLTLPVGLVAVVVLSSFAADEGSGRMTLLFATPVPRSGWYGRIWVVGVASGALVALGAAAGTLLGSSLTSTAPPVGTVLAAAANTVPLLALSIGTSALALGWWPPATALGAVPTVGGFVWFTLADTFGWPDWLVSASPYAHLAAVPVESPDWAGAVTMIMVGLLLTTIGLVGYRRRDLRS